MSAMTGDGEAWAEAIGGRLTERIAALERLTEERLKTQDQNRATALVALREYFTNEVTTLHRDIETLNRTIRETADVHARAHEREHAMTEMAVRKADEALTIRLASMNEFREQITNERGNYVTRLEMAELRKRFEEQVARGSEDLSKAISGPGGMNERLTIVERFVVASNAQMATLRALMALILLGLAIAGFIFARLGM